ncbi:MAG TPA: glycosyltransferase family 2 protein [Flavobacterium sp.]|nr:glycosyltransferase family 2 protein [Flavobacterium sp.]
MNPTVSIIIPCYNSEKFIGETLESILDQTFQDWECLVMDNASTDNSVDVIERFKNEKIHLIKLDKNYGASQARNIGIERAKGRFITFIDSDDLWLPEFLEKSISFLKDENEELVYASYHRVDEELNPLLEDFTAIDNIDFQRILYNCPIPMLTAVYDTKRIGKIKIPDVDMREDHAMWMDILKKIPRARAIQTPLGVYRIRRKSYSRNKLKILQKQFLVYYKFLNLSLPKSTYYTIHWALNGLKKYEVFKPGKRS